MPWTSIGSIATGSSISNDQSSLTTTGVTASANTFLVLILSLDNNQTTDGDESAVSSVTDSASNTWTKGVEFTNGQGTTQTGATCSIWYTKVSNALSSGTITANFTNNTSRDSTASSVWGWAIGAGTVTVEGTPGTLANDAADPGSLNVTTSNIECLRVRGIATESSTNTAITVTSSWTAFTQSIAARAGAAGMATRGEWIVSTGTGSASDPTLFSADHASCYIAFKLTTPSATPRNFGVIIS